MAQTKEYRRAYYLANREHTLAVNQAYRERNPELIVRLKKEWADTNKDKVRVLANARRKANPQARIDYDARYRERNRTRLVSYLSNYYRANEDSIKQRARKWRMDNQAYANEAQRRRGINRWLKRANWSWDEYDIRYSQGCEICGGHGGSTPKTGLCFDHDHDTGKVRGLLCGRCNRFLDWAIGFYVEIGSYYEGSKTT